jgi:3-oxoacyl-[acyl-carrier protein] reductase
MYELHGRHALVTGGSRGIGRACALTLGKLGAYVTVNYCQNEAAAQTTVDMIRNAGGEADLVRFDVRDELACQQSIKHIAGRHGRLDILVNNAGTTAGDGLLLKLPSSALDGLLRSNLVGAFNCTKPTLFFMMRGRWGRIVNVSSVIAQVGGPGQSAYCAAKAGLEGMTRAVAREYAPRGITVNAVAPGLIDTDMTKHLGPDGMRAAAESIPSARVGTPEDVAAVVAFLCSVEAAYVNGQTIGVNGGMHM